MVLAAVVGLVYAARVKLLCSAVALCLLLPTVARADAKTELEKARLAIVAKRYDVARDKAEAALKEAPEGSDPGLRALAYVYLGAAAWLGKDEAAARRAFEQALSIDARVEPDPLSFPQGVMDLFVDTRASMQGRLSQIAIERARTERERRAKEDEEKRRFQQRIALLEAMASQEVRVVKNSRMVAYLPFGVGQFANRQESLGWAFLATEAAFALGTFATYGAFKASRAEAYEEYRRGDPEGLVKSYVEQGDTWKSLNLVFGGAFLATYAVGVAQAQVNFVPEFVETKPRSLPGTLKLSPGVGSLTLSGSF